MKRFKPALGGVFSTLANKYGWTREVLLGVRIFTVIATVTMFWPGIVYFFLIFFKNDL